MIIFILFIIGLSIYEVLQLLNNKNKKDIVVYMLLTVVALVLGFIYFSNPLNQSISEYILKLINVYY